MRWCSWHVRDEIETFIMSTSVTELAIKQNNNEENNKPQTHSQVYVPGITPRPKKTTVFKELDEDSNRFVSAALVPTNLKVGLK